MDALTDDNIPQLENQATSAGREGAGRPRVLIIGGGFGGLFCARRLGRVDVDVTLLDRAACHVLHLGVACAPRTPFESGQLVAAIHSPSGQSHQ
jgi:pyruvate/2-oxoglutarate dehydrogenase complex dihydrolipoamide dehydrogenase (E3) component